MYYIVLDCKNVIIKFKYAACVHIRKIMPIMLALCLMLLHTYYAKNHAGIIDSGLAVGVNRQMAEATPYQKLVYIWDLSTIF